MSTHRAPLVPALLVVVLPGCGMVTVNGKPVEDMLPKQSDSTGDSGGGGGTAAGGEDGWGGAPTPAKAASSPAFVPRCPDGKKYFLGAPESYESKGTKAIVAGDVNGDGKLDLVTGNPYFKPAEPHIASVGAMLNNGDGTFGAMKVSGVGLNDGGLGICSADEVSLGDLNGDGKLDIVTSSPGQGGGRPQYLIGNGDGTFQPQVSLRQADAAGTAFLADLNADKKTDVVLDRWVWLNGGKKSSAAFTRAVALDDKLYEDAIAVADLNGDGSADVVSGSGSKVNVWINDTNGSFTAGKAVALPEFKWGDVAGSGDFNKDGKVDVVLIGSKSLAVLQGQGDGTFAAPSYVAYPDGWESAWRGAVADLNGDKVSDVVVTDTYKGVLVLMGAGDGTFGAPVRMSAGRPTQVAVGDFTGAGVSGLAVVDDTTDARAILVFAPSCR